MDVSLFSSCSHVTIKTRKVDPRAEGGARILIKESSIKAIEKCRDESSLEKSSTDKTIKVQTGCFYHLFQHHNINLVSSRVSKYKMNIFQVKSFETAQQ